MQTPQTLSRPLAQRVAGLNAPLAPIADAPDLPASVIVAATSALDRGETHYTDRPGIPEFRAWVADHLRERYGVGVDPAEVTITCGSTEARYVCMTLLAGPGGSILCPGDSGLIRGAAHLVGARIVDAIQDDISLLYIAPDLYRETSIELLQRAEETDWWIVYDLVSPRPIRHFTRRRTRNWRRGSSLSIPCPIPWRAGGWAGWRARKWRCVCAPASKPSPSAPPPFRSGRGWNGRDGPASYAENERIHHRGNEETQRTERAIER